MNLQNKQTGYIGLNVINKSLDILQSAMHIAPVKIYGPKGAKTGGTRKRHLGIV